MQILETNPVGDTDTDNANTASLDGCHLARQSIDLTGWLAVGDKNGNVIYVRTVAVCSVEDLRSHKPQPTCSVCISAAIVNTSDCRNKSRYVGEIA